MMILTTQTKEKADVEDFDVLDSNLRIFPEHWSVVKKLAEDFLHLRLNLYYPMAWGTDFCLLLLESQ